MVRTNTEVLRESTLTPDPILKSACARVSGAARIAAGKVFGGGAGGRYAWVLLVLVLLGPIGLGGCASVTRGWSEQIQITSQPEGAEVRTSLSQACTTPCTLTVSRKDEFSVSYAKPGYHPQTVEVGTRLASAGAVGFAGNVLVGGIVGTGVERQAVRRWSTIRTRWWPCCSQSLRRASSRKHPAASARTMGRKSRSADRRCRSSRPRCQPSLQNPNRC